MTKFFVVALAPPLKEGKSPRVGVYRMVPDAAGSQRVDPVPIAGAAFKVDGATPKKVTFSRLTALTMRAKLLEFYAERQRAKAKAAPIRFRRIAVLIIGRERPRIRARPAADRRPSHEPLPAAACPAGCSRTLRKATVVGPLLSGRGARTLTGGCRGDSCIRRRWSRPAPEKSFAPSPLRRGRARVQGLVETDRRCVLLLRAGGHDLLQASTGCRPRQYGFLQRAGRHFTRSAAMSRKS